VRQMSYNRLLADYAEHPRTVLLSTHLIDEAAGLFERVLVIDHGAIIRDAAADDVRGAATSVSGTAIAVEEFTAGRTVWDRGTRRPRPARWPRFTCSLWSWAH
jgi:ABC-2 type transport system ATP-binding protein